jgi:hypothetical protein
MSEGAKNTPEPNYPPYGYYYPKQSYPPPDIKSQTKKGVQFMFIGLLLLVISNIFGIFLTIITNYLVSTSGYLSSYWLIFTIFSIIHIGVLLGFIVLLLIALFFFHRGRYEFGAKHENNIKMVRYFVLFYFIILIIQFFVLPMFTIFDPLGMLRITVGISTVFGLILTFLLSFTILYLVRELAQPFELDLLYIFVGVTILLNIIQEVFFAMFYAQLILPSLGRYYAFELFFEILFAILILLAFFAYYRMFKSFDPQGRYTPKESRAFLPRPEPVATHVSKFYARPIPSVIAIIIVSILIGMAIGVSMYVPEIGPNLFEFRSSGDPEYFTDYEEGIEMLQEGQSTSMGMNIQGSITFIEIIVTWEDEPDAVPRENQPDRFSVMLSFDGVEDATHTGENNHGEAGVIYITRIFEEDDLFYTDSLGIEVTLEFAGDQTNRLGIGPGFFNIADDSNEFYYEILVEYAEE